MSAFDLDTPAIGKGSFGRDSEKQETSVQARGDDVPVRTSSGRRFLGFLPARGSEEGNPRPEGKMKWYQWLIDAGFEEYGVTPVPIELRTNRQYNNLFTIFFTSMLSLLPIPTGILATYSFGMSLRDSALIILFFSMLTIAPPAFLAICGPKTGMRQQILTRYSFGLYLALVPLLLNAATVTGFTLLSAVVSGQAISALNPDHVSVKVGIVIICIISFVVTLLGYRTLHFIERWSWIPNLIGLVTAVGCGGKYLHLQAPTEPPAVSTVLSYGGIIAGYFLTFTGTASDYATYHSPNVSKRKIFCYVYFGMLLPSVPLLILGAAIGGAIPNVPAWADAYSVTSVGGIVYEMLRPAHGFGKFLVVLLALSSMGNIAISTYSVSLNLQMLLPIFARIHRSVFIFITFVILIPCSIKAAEQWEESLSNFLAIIGYWAGCYAAVMMEELLIFRRMDYSTYDQAIWNVGKALPTGLAALGASIISFGLVIPCMDEVWYRGPIAKHTGDIGFEVAFAITSIFFVPFRWLEIKWRGRL